MVAMNIGVKVFIRGGGGGGGEHMYVVKRWSQNVGCMMMTDVTNLVTDFVSDLFFEEFGYERQ